MAITNCTRFACLSASYTVVLLYSFGSLYTTIFFQGATLSSPSTISNFYLNSNRSKSLPVIVRPVDGLGNQLFQYSVSYSIARRRNSDLYICLSEKDFANVIERENISSLGSYSYRSYILDVFNIPHDKLLIIPEGEKDCPLHKLPGNITSDHFSIFTDRDLMVNQINKENVIQFDGYGESEMFFSDYKNELMEFLTFKDNFSLNFQELEEIMKKINDTESVAVHVRRGDFNRYKRTIPISYYSQAMQLMVEQMTLSDTNVRRNLTFFIFSDDIESAERDFNQTLINKNYKIVYCSNSNFSRVEDFYLMTKCKHNIIANSTFSWWAAYLNKYVNKLVIAPLPKFNSRWFYKISKTFKNIFGAEWNYPAQWITINPFA